MTLVDFTYAASKHEPQTGGQHMTFQHKVQWSDVVYTVYIVLHLYVKLADVATHNGV